MARRTRDRSPLSTHYRSVIGGVDVLVHKGLIRAALRDIEDGADPTDAIIALPCYTFTEWETGEYASLDTDDLLTWFEIDHEETR